MNNQPASLQPRDHRVLGPSRAQWRRAGLPAFLDVPLWARLGAALQAGNAKLTVLIVVSAPLVVYL